MSLYVCCKTAFRKCALTRASDGSENSSRKYDVLVKGERSTFRFLVNRKETVSLNGETIGLKRQHLSIGALAGKLLNLAAPQLPGQ